MLRSSLLLLAAAGLLIGCTIHTAPLDSSAARRPHQPARPPVDWHSPAPAPPDSAAAQLAVLHNRTRVQRGGGFIALVPKLVACAQKHADWMAANSRMSHTGAGGSSPFDRMKATGYRFSSAGENVAAGQRDADAAFAAWMGSSGHRANILNASFTDCGFGMAVGSGGQKYWCAVYARPKG